MDSKAPSIPFDDYTSNENRYRMLKKNNPKGYDELMRKADHWAKAHFSYYEKLAALTYEETGEKK